MSDHQSQPSDLLRIETLLRDLICSFLQKPEELKIIHQAAKDGSVYWAVKGASCDEGKLIGKGGCHADALEFLVEEIGRMRGQTFTFRLVTVNQDWNSVAPEYRNAVEFDAEPFRKLLVRLLEELQIASPTVRVGPGSGSRQILTFLFEIEAAPSDFTFLTVPHSGNEDRQTIIASIGTIFRAAARHTGVRFDVTVLSAKKRLVAAAK
jgi:predicted RNA-binding protein YlqC (UPF0109 family)